MQLSTLSLALSAPRGRSSVITSAITSLTILGPSDTMDITGDYSDATVRAGINGNGWVAKVTVPYLVAQTFDPTKIVLTVSDPGYDATGTVTRTRTIRGGTTMRRMYTAGAVGSNNSAPGYQEANDGITLTIFFSLQDDVYQGSTVTAVAESGFYGSSQAGAVASVTKNSTVAYEKPLGAWLNIQHERATGSSFNVEYVAYHRHMQQGRQVARVEFIAKDSQATPNVAATQTASTPSLSSFQTQGFIAEAYKASIPLTNLTQADLCFVNAKVYPWIGDSTAILDLEVDGVNATGNVNTAQTQTVLRFLNDKNGTYGGAHVAVKAGAAGTAAFGDYASAVAAPCGTINAALTALVTYNNANKSHNDHSGGTIWLMEDSSGAGANHTTATSGVTANLTQAAGKCWTDIKVDTAATGAVKVTMAATRTTIDFLRWMVNIDHTGLNGLDGGSNTSGKHAAFEAMTLTVTGAPVPIHYRCGFGYFRNVTVSGLGTSTVNNPLGNFSAPTRTQCALALGMLMTDATYTGSTQIMFPQAMIGCDVRRHMFKAPDSTNQPNLDPADGQVIANCRFMANRGGCQLGYSAAFTRGIALVQTVIERAVGASQPALQIAADAAADSTANVVIAYVTIPGTDTTGRMNYDYQDDTQGVGDTHRSHMLYCLLYERNTKNETFTTNTTLSDRTGNWRTRYMVGTKGTVLDASWTGGSGNGVSTDGSGWLAEFMPTSCKSNATVNFTNNQSGTAGSGAGDYTLTSTNPDVFGRVASGEAGLGYDLAGVARLNDGNGACGAYERP
jgi:hypothetical protein